MQQLISDPLEILQDALDAAIMALDDWTHTYAPELCDETQLNETNRRLMYNGTIWYIATVVQQCKDARGLLKC